MIPSRKKKCSIHNQVGFLWMPVHIDLAPRCLEDNSCYLRIIILTPESGPLMPQHPNRVELLKPDSWALRFFSFSLKTTVRSVTAWQEGKRESRNVYVSFKPKKTKKYKCNFFLNEQQKPIPRTHTPQTLLFNSFH